MIHELTPLFSAHPFSQQIKHTSQGLPLSLFQSLLLQCTQNNNVKNEPLHHPLIIMLDRIQSLFWVNNSFYPFIVSYSLIKTHTTWPLATTESSRDDGPEALEEEEVEKSAWYEKSPPLSVSFFL